MSKKVIVAGHVCLDITPIFVDQEPRDIAELMIPGKLIQMKAADVHTGGAVSNTGLAMKFFGADVQLMCKVGRDDFGQSITTIFKQHSAESELIVDEGTTTSYSVVIAAPGIDRIFLHHPGANDTFCNDDITDISLEDVKLFHFGYPTIMKKMYTNEAKETITLFKRIHSKGIITSLDMSAIDSSSEAAQQNWREILYQLLPFVDIFAPSAEEICYMLNQEKLADWSKRAHGGDITDILNIEEDIEPLGKELITMGAKIVLIKCGALGIYYRTASNEKLTTLNSDVFLKPTEWSDKIGFEESYQPDCVLSATGAGDTTIAAFLTGILKGYSLGKCLQLATATGASNVTSYDALSGLLPFETLESKINSGWKKMVKNKG